MVREGPRVCHVCRRDMEVSVGSDLVCSCRTVTFRVQTTVDWPRVHWVDTSDGGCSLKLVREQAQLNLLDLIIVEHGCVLVPNLRLRHVIAGDIRPPETISRQIN